MENEKSLVHHVVKQYGCGYIIKNDESLNEKTQGHPMKKFKPKLI
jgi:hypothetical protein